MPEYAPLSVTIDLPILHVREREAYELIRDVLNELANRDLIDLDTDVTWRVRR